MIYFKQDIELTVVESYDEKHDVITGESQEIFRASENVDADILDDDGTSNYVNLEFGDGSIALGVQRDCFVVVTK